MRILITGGAGYIGSVLTSYLLDLSEVDQVTVLDNFMHNQTSLAHLCANPALEIVNGDVRNSDTLRPLLKDADVVIPLAAIVGAPACDRDINSARDTNIGAIQDIVISLSTEQRLIIPITNSGYGVGEPGKECTETSPLKPLSLYGKTKVAAEETAHGHYNAVSLRLATVFGWSPRMRLDLLVNDFVWRAVTDRAVVLFEADFKRNYIHIRDVALTFVHVLRNWDEMKGQIYNVGLSEANLSKRELCAQIKNNHVPEFVALESPVGADPDKRDYIVSNAKLEATGWQPAWSLDAGIEELIKGYKMLRKTAYGNV